MYLGFVLQDALAVANYRVRWPEDINTQQFGSDTHTVTNLPARRVLQVLQVNTEVLWRVHTPTEEQQYVIFTKVCFTSFRVE